MGVSIFLLHCWSDCCFPRKKTVYQEWRSWCLCSQSGSCTEANLKCLRAPLSSLGQAHAAWGISFLGCSGFPKKYTRLPKVHTSVEFQGLWVLKRPGASNPLDMFAVTFFSSDVGEGKKSRGLSILSAPMKLGKVLSLFSWRLTAVLSLLSLWMLLSRSWIGPVGLCCYPQQLWRRACWENCESKKERERFTPQYIEKKQCSSFNRNILGYF